MLGARANSASVGRVIPRDTPALVLLRRYVRLALDETLSSNAGLSDVVGSHLYDLAALAIGAATDCDPRAISGVRAARLRVIKADILAHLADPDLDVAAIALRQGITPRYVHKLFEGEATTFSAFVLRERLACVRRMLCDPHRSGQSISTLAYRAGFGDLSYFNRAFRRQYGATPSEVRHRARDVSRD
jgi:AraC-like DNA-binding protein